MPSYQFDRPIPGQSLTVEPRNAPYERPPEIVDPEEALMVHLTKLNDPDALADMVNWVEMGLDIQTLTEGIVRSAVMEGIHTIDVSLIVAPVIHEFIRTAMDELGVEYDEGFDNKKARKTAMYGRAKVTAASKAMGINSEVKSAKKDSKGGVSLSDLKEVAPKQQQQEQMSAMQGDITQMELPMGDVAAEAEAPTKRAGLMERK